MRHKNKGPRQPGPRPAGSPTGSRAGAPPADRFSGPERAAGDDPRKRPKRAPRGGPRRDEGQPEASRPGDPARRPATRTFVPRPESPARPSRQVAEAEPNPDRAPRRGPRAEGAEYWLYGRHAVEAALANPARNLRRLLLSEHADERLKGRLAEHPRDFAPEVIGRVALEGTLPAGAVHQGLALRAEPLFQPSLPVFLQELQEGPAVILALDHVTDPQNVGAILRSAAAFGAAAVLSTTDHAPPESGALAKTASGGLEVVPYLRETNLVRALELLKQAGFWCFGLDEAGETLLGAADPAPRTCLVLGAEGEGLRRLTRERCDALVRLPTKPPIAALNVSNAAAVGLYELLGRQT